jgi:hypothetical protein
MPYCFVHITGVQGYLAHKKQCPPVGPTARGSAQAGTPSLRLSACTPSRTSVPKTTTAPQGGGLGFEVQVLKSS